MAFYVYYLIVIYKALDAVSPRNRDMEPAMIFLILIPCFGLIWYFFIVLRLASSLQKEFEDRGIRSDGDFGKMVGILGPILSLTVCLSPGGIICAIIHMVKIKNYTKQLEDKKSRGSMREDDDEMEEDRPRPRRKRDDDDE